MRLTDGQTEHALTVLTRLAQREPKHFGALAAAVRRGLPRSLPAAMRVAMATGEPMAEVLTALARELGADQLALVRALLPVDSAALRLLTATVLDRLLAHAPAEPDDVAERIALLTHRAESLIEIGAPRQALPVAREAVDLAGLDRPAISYEVAEVVPEALRVLSRCQLSNGDYAAAVDTAARYVQATRFNCLESPCAEVAGAHHTLATRLRHAGRIDEAREHYALARELFERLLDDPLWYVRDVKARVATTPEDALAVATGAALGMFDELGIQPGEVIAYVSLRFDRNELLARLVNTRLALADLADELDQAAITELTQLTELTQELVDADRDRHLPLHVLALTLLMRRSRRLEQAETFLARARAAAEASGAASSLSGGAFVRWHVEALLAEALAAEKTAGTIRVGELLTVLRKVVGLYRSVRVPELLLSESPILTVFTEQLLAWARLAEQAADDEEASRLIDDTHEGATLLHQISPHTCYVLVECLIVRSRIADRAGRTRSALQDLLTAREHLPHLGDTTRQVVVGAAIDNNISLRYSALGDPESAAATAADGLRTIIDSGFHATDRGAWLMAVSMAHTCVNQSKIEPGSFVDRHTDDLLALLAAAPTPPAENEAALQAHSLGFALLLHHIALPNPRVRDAALRALRHVMARPGLPVELRHGCARRGYETLCLCVDARELDAAQAVYALLVDLAGDRTDPGTFVEQAKAATELIQAYQLAGRRQDAIAIARQALPVMRTPEYLTARERDLGQPAHVFLAALDSLLAAGR
jgi:tetratricopeptide (TPR) repeat protein